MTSISYARAVVKPPYLRCEITCPECRGEDDGCTRCGGRRYINAVKLRVCEFGALAESADAAELVQKLLSLAESLERQGRHARTTRRHNEADMHSAEALAHRTAAAALHEILTRGPKPPARIASASPSVVRLAYRLLPRTA